MRALCGMVLAICVLGLPSISWAESRTTVNNGIRMQGRTEVVVTEPTIRLADVAQVESVSVSDDDRIVQLRQIVLGQSPRAGESKVVEGMQILQVLRDNGVQLDSILYSFPREITVTRAFREVPSGELEKALQLFLVSQKRQIDVKQLVMDSPVKIPTDSFGVEVVGLRAMQPGHFGVDYRSLAGKEEMRFQMRAIGDEWRLMPVAAKPLKKGMIISANDVQLSRVNGTAASRDMVEQLGDLVGRSLVRDVGQGEMFQSNSIMIPAVVAAGSRVTMVYRHGRLEATAIGTALESGGERQEIKVRNEASKKVVPAIVVEKGVVVVGAQ